MNPAEKATRVLSLLNRPVAGQSAAISRLLDIPPEELDSLLSDLETDALEVTAALASWSKPGNRNRTAVKKGPGADSAPWVTIPFPKGTDSTALDIYARNTKMYIEQALIKAMQSSPDVRKMLTLLVGENADSEITSILNTYFSMHSEKITKDIFWMIAEKWESGFSPALRNALHKKFGSVYMPETLSDRPDQISPTQAIAALVKIARLTDANAPDLIVSVSRGGKIISDFVTSFLNIDEKKTIYIDHESRNIKNSHDLESLKKTKPRRVLVIDSISRSGKTINWTFNVLRQYLATSDLHATCLAATFEASEALGEQRFFAPLASPIERIRPPWNSHGIHQIFSDSHYFGVDPAQKSADSPPQPGGPVFEVPKSVFDMQYSYIK